MVVLTAATRYSQRSSPTSPMIVLANFLKSLAAVVIGNLIYFFLLMPLLPPAGHHQIFRADWGLVIDFWVCVAVYGALELLLRKTRRASGR